MTPAPEQCAQEFARLLDAQTAVCREILEKSRTQQKLVEERNEEKLLALLADKQNLIDKHQKLVEKTGAAREQWEGGARARVPAESRALVERAWSGLRDVLDEIVRLEDASRNMLEDQKGRLSIDIGRIQRGKIVNRAYGGSQSYRPPAQPRYSDKQG